MALTVQAPAAGASTTITPPAKDVGVIPFPGDVYTLNYQGALVPVDPELPFGTVTPAPWLAVHRFPARRCQGLSRALAGVPVSALSSWETVVR